MSQICLQAFWQILVPSLLAFCKEHDRKYHDDIALLIYDKSDIVVKLLSLLAEERFQSVLSSFIDMRSKDVNFDFWCKYMQMVEILQLFIRAQRDGNWDLHIYSFQLMLPYFIRYDHMNYARWGAVYLDELQRLPQAILAEFKRGISSSSVLIRYLTKLIQTKARNG